MMDRARLQKASVQKQRNAVRNCIFCGNTPLTKEHLLGKWIKEVFPQSGVKQNTMHRVSEIYSNGRQEFFRGLIGGDMPAHFTAKLVYSTCNNGWMSKIERMMAETCRKLQLPDSTKPYPNIVDLMPHTATIKTWMNHKTALHFAATPPTGKPYQNIPLIYRATYEWVKKFSNSPAPSQFDYLVIVPTYTGNNLVGMWNLLKGPMRLYTEEPYDPEIIYTHFIPMKKFVFISTNWHDYFSELANNFKSEPNTTEVHLDNGSTACMLGNSVDIYRADELVAKVWQKLLPSSGVIRPFTGGYSDLYITPSSTPE